MEYVPIDKSNWTVGRTLAVQAERRGDSPFLQFGETSPVSFAETDRLANRIANGLIALGLEPGERVAVMLDNSLEYCLAWFGANRAGAVHVAVNTAYKGTFLSHLINNSAARFAVIAEAFLPRFLEIRANLPALQHLIVVGGPSEAADADSAEFRPTTFDALLDGGD
ncbi:MAG: acyl--CoA ligase, partial [Proteobacteria bacterium]|nr:acyl--CoA ligase [Pseudomonadota bacterium]